MDESFDYIVVGGGSAGSIVAGELASDPAVRVLVLEAGDPADSNPETLVADQYKNAFINDRVMWERFSVPQRECHGNRLFMGSGRGLGGSGAVNAMVYTRGTKFDFSRWNTAGWTWDALAPAFAELESRLTIRQQPPTRFTEACIAAACDAGFRHKPNLNDGELSGFLGYNWMNNRGNERRHSYAAFLRPREGQPNLTVRTGALARRVIFEGRRAVGVEYEREGRVETARAAVEVVLTAGALETPRLLMLSGVGPRAELERHGIPVVLDAPAIGQNLMDHPNVQVFFRGRERNDCTWAQLYGFHRANPDSALPPGEADTCYVFYSCRSSFKEGMIRLLPGMVLPERVYGWGWPARAIRRGIKTLFRAPGVTPFVDRMWGIVVILGKPKSRGSIRLRSSDPRARALIDPAYFSEREDLDTLVKGVARARQIAAQPALAAWGNTELLPGRLASSEKGVARFVRQQVMTTYHYAGTCRMGDDEAAPVDGALRLRGVEGVRVADASVIPEVPVSAMNAPSMIIGYRAAQLLRSTQPERGRSTRPHAVTVTV